MTKARPFIIVTSDEPWSDVWHTQLQYAHQLAKRFRVIFLGPPESWKLKNLFRFSLREKSVEKYLSVVRYVNLLPAVFGNFALTVNDRLTEFLIKRKFFDSRMPQKLLVWHFDRYRSFRIFTSSDSVRHIYHVIDPVANLNGDVELSRRADLVVVTSPRFLDHYRDLNKNVIRIGQGHDTAVAKSEIIPEETGLKDSIVLLGTITDDIDFALLQEIALRFPNPLFLIGPDKIIRKECREAFEKLLSQPGVRWLGAMPPSGFSKYLYSCKAGLITYDLSGISRNTLRSPLKVISYLAFGKCVISNIDCEIPELTGKGVYIASDKSDFIQKLQLALESKLEIDAAAIKNYLDSISYKKLLEQIFRQLGEELPEEFVS